MKQFVRKAALLLPACLLLLLSCTSTISVAADTTGSGACGSAANSPTDQVLQGVTQANDGGTTDCQGSGVTNIVQAVVTILSYIVGVISVIMIIIAGLRYMTAGGDSNRISSAKNTLMYALIGLAIAALAQFFVHAVLNTATGAEPCASNSSIAASSPQCQG